MTTRMLTCTCGEEIVPSHIGPAPSNGVLPSKGEMTFPAACPGCGKTYPDVVSVPLTLADLEMVRDRLSESTRQELAATATERTPGCYDVVIAEDRARDLASKAANLGLAPIANKVRHELAALTLQRRQR